MKKFMSPKQLGWEAGEQSRLDAMALLGVPPLCDEDLNPDSLDLLARYRKDDLAEAETTCAMVVTLIATAQLQDGDFTAPDQQVTTL